MSLVRSTDRPDLRLAAVQEAAALLRDGAIVALPTETVYGLAANAFDPQAVQKIFAAKGRPSHNPLIVHVASLEMARVCANDWPESAERLAAAFWPGPLTLVLPKSSVIPNIVTAEGPTVGIRWPNHPIMQAVIEACRFPLAAPSANRSGAISPTTAGHVLRGLGTLIPLILDGGSSAVGIESTVLDLTVTPARILRPGTIHSESLAAVLGEEIAEGPDASPIHRSPGLLLKHYAPKAKVLLWSGTDPAGLQEALRESHLPAKRIHILARTANLAGVGLGKVCVMPGEPGGFAKALYAELHRCDDEAAALIVIEGVPKGAAWQGIADRLRRAAA